MSDFVTLIAEHRKRTYRQDEPKPVHNVDEALAFLNETGFCLGSFREGLELPNLAGVADGPFRRWKDELLNKRLIYYGRPFRRRLAFVRLDLLPCLYALTPTADFNADRFELYKRRYLTADANRVAGVVHAKGPLPTRALRRESGMASPVQRRRFQRALAEAESRYLIAKSRMTTVEASHYSYLWETFTDVYAEAAENSYDIDVKEAAERIVIQYIGLVGAATVRQVASVFTLNDLFVQHVADQLCERGMLGRCQIAGQTYVVDMSIAAGCSD